MNPRPVTIKHPVYEPTISSKMPAEYTVLTSLLSNSCSRTIQRVPSSHEKKQTHIDRPSRQEEVHRERRRPR